MNGQVSSCVVVVAALLGYCPRAAWNRKLVSIFDNISTILYLDDYAIHTTCISCLLAFVCVCETFLVETTNCLDHEVCLSLFFGNLFRETRSVLQFK